MGIPEDQKPDACSCSWEEVTSFADADIMIERAMTDPDCPVHAKG